jgi:hypothetical protein
MLLITAKVREQTIGRAQREERRLAWAFGWSQFWYWFSAGQAPVICEVNYGLLCQSRESGIWWKVRFCWSSANNSGNGIRWDDFAHLGKECQSLLVMFVTESKHFWIWDSSAKGIDNAFQIPCCNTRAICKIWRKSAITCPCVISWTWSNERLLAKGIWLFGGAMMEL